MKNFFALILVFSSLAVGCKERDVSMRAEGYVTLKNGSPSVGAQGELCAIFVTDKNNGTEFCKSLFTDQKGYFYFNLYESIDRLYWNSIEITSIKIKLKIGSVYYSIKTLDPKKIDLNNSIQINFVNTDGFAWGKGTEVEEKMNQSKFINSTDERDLNFEDYIDLQSTLLNPIEFIVLVNQIYSTDNRDRLIWTYTRRALAQGKLNQNSILLLAPNVYNSEIRNKILSQSTSPCAQP